MSRRGHPLFLAIFVLVLAPVGAAVIICALILFGVKPALVFAPGHFVMSLLRNPPNAVGVLTTEFVWWLAIVAIGLAWEWWRRDR